MTALANGTGPAPAPAPETLPRRLQRWLLAPRHLVGCALLRLAVGAVVLYQLLGHAGDRHLLWGPEGAYPAWLFARELAANAGPSYLAVGSALAFEVAFAVAVVVAVLYLLGWQTRWTGVWMAVVVWSLVKRNPLLLTGGDTLLLVMMPFLLFLDTAAYLSVDSGWRPPGAPPPPRGPAAALLHNVALACVFVQLAITYLAAGGYKLLGASWPAGTAVHYTLLLPEFHRPGLAEALVGRPAIVAALTWGTLAFELSVPLLLWSRRTRWLVTLQAVVFHGFIAWSMGLVLFAAQAIAFQLPLHSDAAYRALLGRLAAFSRRGAARPARPDAGGAVLP